MSKFLDIPGLTYFWGKVKEQLNTKVDKADGKQLSSNDYTAAEKTKLAGIATGATKYTHPGGDGNLHVPVTGTTNNGKFLMAGSTAGALSWGIPSVSVADMKGATSSAAGTHGLVPAPAAGKQSMFLRGDGTWVTPPNTTYEAITTAEIDAVIAG